MAQRDMAMGLALVVLIAIWAGAKGQTDCTNELISMSPCLNYITGNSSTPSSGCCTQLGSVVSSSPQCLCQVLNGGGSSLGIDVNQTRALALPGQCNVQTPPVSRCNATSPAASPSGTSGSPKTSSGSGSKNVPSTDSKNTSEGSSNKLSIFFLLLLASVSYYCSTFTEY